MNSTNPGNVQSGATALPPVKDVIPETEQRPNASGVRALSAPSTVGLKSNFAVTFDCSRPNTKRLGQLMKSINASLISSKLPEQEEKLVLKLLHQINDNINALQLAELPESSLTKTFAREVIDNIIKNPRIPEHLRNSVDLLFNFFSLCKQYDYFIYGGIDRKLCRSMADFLSFIPDGEPVEIMAGAGWLQKGLKDQGQKIRSTDNFRIKSDLYQDSDLAAKILANFRMREHAQDFAVIEGATVETKDALDTLRDSDSRVVIMCWPDMRPENLVYDILEHCYKNQKLIIHVSHKGESLDKLVVRAGHRNEANAFIPVTGAPSSHVHGENMSVGFWKEVPKWFMDLKSQQAKSSKNDFMIRHFKP